MHKIKIKMAMQKPPHLQYLRRELDWYIGEHADRQSTMGQSRSVQPAYNINQVLKRNKGREYKGVHHFCGAEEDGELLTCVIFKRTKPGLPVEYFHTLYLGPETQNSLEVERLILERLGITVDDVQKSLIAKH